VGKPPIETFLCFQRRAAGDVLIGTAKICGSAQRRHRGALLQHGSVILQTSRFAQEIAGIEELCGATITGAALADAWSVGLASRLKVQWQIVPRTAAEELAVEELRSRRFSSGDWLVRR
jgi:lipoate-protein ligase A